MILELYPEVLMSSSHFMYYTIMMIWILVIKCVYLNGLGTCIFLNDNLQILIQISLKYAPMGTNDNDNKPS